MARPEFIFTFQNSCDNVPVTTFTPSDNGGKQAFTVTGYDVSDYLDAGDELTFNYSGSFDTYTVISIVGNMLTMSFDYNAAITNVNTYLQFSIKTSANPINFLKGRFEWQKDKDNYFYRLKYSGKLTFKNNQYSDDWNYLFFALDDECCNILFKVYKLCGGEYSLYYRSNIRNDEGTWNESNCTFESEILPVDKYRCIDAIMDDEVNLYPDLNGIARLSLNYADDDASGNSPFMDYYVSPTIPIAPFNNSYVAPDGGPNFTEIINAGYASDPNTGNPWTVTARDVKYVTYTGDPINFVTPAIAGWTAIPSAEIREDGKIIAKYARLSTSSLMERTGEVWGTGGICDPDQARAIIYDPVNDNCISVKLYNGTDFTSYRYVTLQESLETLLSRCGGISELTSDFFEINPIGDTFGYSPGINYITGEYNFLNYLLLSSISDVLYPAGDPATVMNYSLGKLLTDLRTMFNVYWFLDDQNRFRIEHQAWFISNNIANISAYNYNKYLKVYSYIKGETPNREKFTFKYASNTDFLGTDVVYSQVCTDKPTTLVRSSQMVTDIDYLRSTPPEQFTPDTIVMFSTEPVINSGVVLYDTGKITGLIMQNMHLSWANLQFNYHQYGRILQTGLMNYIQENFITWLKRRKQLNQTYQNCCLSIPGTLGNITTEVGVGNAVKIVYNIEDSTYEFELEI